MAHRGDVVERKRLLPLTPCSRIVSLHVLQFNTPVQLGPASSTKPHDARIFTIPVQEDDILILASDGLSDNLWDGDILDEVVRFRRSFMGTTSTKSNDSNAPESAPPTPAGAATATPAPSATFRRSTLAGMLSEALCSRAKRVSETRGSRKAEKATKSVLTSTEAGASTQAQAQAQADVPFARRAKEQGKLFEGGKPDGEFVRHVIYDASRGATRLDR